MYEWHSPPFFKALAKKRAVVAVTGLNLIELGSGGHTRVVTAEAAYTVVSLIGVSQTHCRPRPELDIDLIPVHLSPGKLGGRSQARWLTAPGRRRLCRWKLVSPILFSLSVRFIYRGREE